MVSCHQGILYFLLSNSYRFWLACDKFLLTKAQRLLTFFSCICSSLYCAKSRIKWDIVPISRVTFQENLFYLNLLLWDAEHGIVSPRYTIFFWSLSDKKNCDESLVRSWWIWLRALSLFSRVFVLPFDIPRVKLSRKLFIYFEKILSLSYAFNEIQLFLYFLTPSQSDMRSDLVIRVLETGEWCCLAAEFQFRIHVPSPDGLQGTGNTFCNQICQPSPPKNAKKVTLEEWVFG